MLKNNEVIELALNIEDDFIEAKINNQAHPKVNSGDFIKHSNTKFALAGACGEFSSESSKESDIGSAADKSEKSRKINNFLNSVKKFLKSANKEELESLVGTEDINLNKPTLKLFEKLKDIKNITKIDKGNSLSAPKLSTTNDFPKTTSELSPIKELKKLYLERKEAEKKANFDKEINAELNLLRENESHETKYPIETKRAEFYIQTTKSLPNITTENEKTTTKLATETISILKLDNKETTTRELDIQTTINIAEKSTLPEQEYEITTVRISTESTNLNNETSVSFPNNEVNSNDIIEPEDYSNESKELVIVENELLKNLTTTDNKQQIVNSLNLKTTDEIVKAVMALHKVKNLLLNQTNEYDNFSLKELKYKIKERIKIDNLTLLKVDNKKLKTELKDANKKQQNSKVKCFVF